MPPPWHAAFLPDPGRTPRARRIPALRRPTRRTAVLALALTLTAALITTIVLAQRPLYHPHTPIRAGAPSDHHRPSPSIDTITVTDPRTADPCSLIDPDQMNLATPPRISENFGFFSACHVNIDLGAEGGTGEVMAKFEGPLPPGDTLGGDQEQLGQVTVARFDEQDGQCARRLLFSDRTYLRFLAFESDDPEADPCTQAEAVLGSAIQVLATDGIGTRVPLDAFSALAGVDACDLLAPSDLAVVPGFELEDPLAGFGDWSCKWDGADGTAVFVQYTRLNPNEAQEGQPASFGDRAGAVEVVGDTCYARIPQRTVTGDVGCPVVLGPRSNRI